MSLELGSRFRLPDGRLVEVVPDIEEILGIDKKLKCTRCAAITLSNNQCDGIGCGWIFARGFWTRSLSNEYPRILKEVENEP